jgi:hypothetical protein
MDHRSSVRALEREVECRLARRKVMMVIRGVCSFIHSTVIAGATRIIADQARAFTANTTIMGN